MSLKKNILANYAGQIYVTLIGIVMVPMYIKYMGAEAYGLVGFFAMLQMWFSMLDMGLSPTMARETARYRGGAIDALIYRRLVRALEGVFLVVAIVGGTTLYIASDYIAKTWLQASQLPISEVKTALQIMAVITALRWMSGIYRSTISGSEKLVWLSTFNSMIATLRFVGVLPLLLFVGATPTIFFSFQVGVALLELTLLIFFAYRHLPNMPWGQRLSWKWAPLQPVLKFSMTIAFASAVGVLVTQTDKLVLSGILNLADYGHFTLAVLAASGVMMISGPVSAAIMPRMSKLEAEADYAGIIHVYRQATQLVAVLAGATTTTVVFCAEPLLWAWTGDKLLAHQVSPIVIWYALGNSIFAVAGFPYFLQYAKGDLRLHLIGNAVFILIFAPLIIWVATKYGVVGAGYVWFGMNMLSFIAWLPLVHRKFAPGINLKWYFRDILIIYLVAFIAGYGLSSGLQQYESRVEQVIMIIGFAFVVFSISACASTTATTELTRIFKRIFIKNPLIAKIPHDNRNE
jgi:O-antigen/teichoic acid export membrane protein